MPIDVWQLFLTDQMIYEIVQNTKNTNVWDWSEERWLSKSKSMQTQVCWNKGSNWNVVYAGNAEDVPRRFGGRLVQRWLRCGIFPLVMSLFRFKFLLRALRFDDLNSREDRKLLDKLAPIREIFEKFVDNCNKNEIVSEFVTIDEMLDKSLWSLLL